MICQRNLQESKYSGGVNSCATIHVRCKTSSTAMKLRQELHMEDEVKKGLTDVIKISVLISNFQTLVSIIVRIENGFVVL